MDKQAAEDALKYTDLVAAGRAQIIDANLLEKLLLVKVALLVK